ncbi:MAG: FtsX-like permease family protein [Candidatus Aminicenantes bacterium]|nr:FtsX-like permease family protein [Candidatus Aminicenantes bacterium]
MRKKREKIPALAAWILARMIRDEDRLSILSDFSENYEELINEKGYLEACRWYWDQVLKSIPMFMINILYWRLIMFKNFLRITLRNIRRHKGYSFINISGLAVGMACFILIALYIQKEFSFDTFHDKADRIYRILEQRSSDLGMEDNVFCTTVAPLAPTLLDEFAEVSHATRIHTFYNEDFLFVYDKKSFYEKGLLADKYFFDVFSFRLIEGDSQSALAEPLSLIISEKLAAKYFGNDKPLGKTISLNGRLDVKITGVVEEIPDNSHIQFDFLLSLDSIEILRYDENFLNYWNRAREYYTYIELHEAVNPKNFAKKLPRFVGSHMVGVGLMEDLVLSLQPLKSIHLRSKAMRDLAENNSMQTIIMFSLIAFLILLIACINYMNILTARTSKRSKEIGVRNTLGASRRHLLIQFIGESFVHTIIAFCAAVLIAKIVLQHFNAAINRELTLNIFGNSQFLLVLVGMIVLTGLFSGIYPAFYMSSFPPAKILKGTHYHPPRLSRFRNVLVVTQFCISVLLINSTLVILKQLNFIRNTELGYNREHVLVSPIRDLAIINNFETIKNILLQNPNIVGVTRSDNLPLSINSVIGIKVEDAVGVEVERGIATARVDSEFLDVFEIELLSGRNFSDKFANDTQESVLLNETAVKHLGLMDPIGKKCLIWPATKGKVIGVVKDFSFHSLHQEIGPLALTYYPDVGRFISVKIKPSNLQSTIQFIKNTIDSFESVHPFTFSFMDDTFNSMYQREQNTGSFFGYFSAIAIILAYLGLFGLVAHKVESRIKDIGIRKVLGASVREIVVYLSKEFFILIGIANFIAIPIIFIAMHEWLQTFAYRISVGGEIFLLSCGLTLIITFLTVSFQTIKAATASPVDSLRYE